MAAMDRPPSRSRPTRTTLTSTLTICLLTMVVVMGVELGDANVIADEKVGGQSEPRRRTGEDGKVVRDDWQVTGAPRDLADTHSKANSADGRLKTARLLDGLQSYEISIPSLVDRVGDFISYDVTHRRLLTRRRHRRKRSGAPEGAVYGGETTDDDDPWLFYRVSAFGREFRLNVSRNRDLLAPSFVVEVWNESGGVEERRSGGLRKDCLYTGHIVDEETTSRVALSNCDGLFGVFATESEEFFVEPLWNDSTKEGGGGGGNGGDGVNSLTSGQRHVIYRRTAIKDMHPDDVQRYTCATPPAEHDEKLRWHRRNNELGFRNDRSLEKERKWRGRKSRRRKKRSFSRENYVETLVVVDKQMVKYHGLDAIEPYVLTIMNIVAKLYRDASIGNDINIVVARIIVLTESQKDLEITYHADKSLESFCRWQNRINQGAKANDSNLPPHDTAILITRFDICTYKNQPCGTLGLAPVAGMCDPGRSCSIIEDIGIATAFTIAHELGHNFGMQHDGTGNVCGLPDQEPAKLMASQLAKNTEPFSWSSCSRSYITAFLDSGKGDCLRNTPHQLKRLAPEPLPGQIHSGDAQCRYQFGPKSTQCHQELDMCRELWCYNPSNQCVTNSIPSAEGTPCSSPKVKLGWCYHGACMKVGWRPKVVNGQWNVWSPWSSCSRSCGGGVETSERFCTNPRPQHGGKYCIGERRRYRSCNVFDCPANSTDFREVQCSKFNDELFRGKYYKWKPFTGGVGLDVKPCALSCMAVGHHFYTERAPKVVDGTRCYPNSLDMCIDGLCLAVGCDGILGSEAVEDKCRVCGGDGTRCRTVRGVYDALVDVGGESYIEAVRIPRGAMNILVTEKKLSRNYLALKSGGPDEKYFVNGAWTIDWPRQFEIANTTFTYEREKDKPESLKALGPISEDLSVMLLMQEKNQGVLFEYSLASTKAIENSSAYGWKYGEWSQCTVTCGRGVSQLTAICVNKNYPTVAVSEKNCQSLAKFHNKMKYCNEEPCPPEWSLGDWTECSKPCGGGWKTRMISCVQKIDQMLNEVTQNVNCFSKKPKSKHRCNGHKCPAQWQFDEWSECRPSCGAGMRTRNVYCINGRGRYTNESNCNATKKPQNLEKCHTTACPPPTWRTGAWGECSVSCGLGKQMRTVACRTYSGEASTDCDQSTVPHNIQECDAPCHVTRPENSDCQDLNDVGYCPLVLKFKFCNRPYFRQMCCRTCMDAGL